jgi:hypothetical protein
MDMMNKHTDKHPQYEIKVADQLDGRWQEWFDGLTITSTAEGSRRKNLVTYPIVLVNVFA